MRWACKRWSPPSPLLAQLARLLRRQADAPHTVPALPVCMPGHCLLLVYALWAFWLRACRPCNVYTESSALTQPSACVQ